MWYDPIVSWMDPILHPITFLPPLLGIAIVAFIVALISKLLYRALTDQVVMKAIREDIKKYQAQMKQHRDDHAKIMEINTKAMEKNMQYMSATMKPMLVSMLPILLLFGWMSLNLAYEPVLPNAPFDVVATMREMVPVALTATPALNISEPVVSGQTIRWTLNGPEGEYLLNYTTDGASLTQPLIIDEAKYAHPQVQGRAPFNNVKILNTPKSILDVGPISFNWFWTYVILSVLFSLLLQKLLKLH